MSAGQSLGRYLLLEKLGEGGMGAVYRARDSRLGRDVALKVLPSEVAGDPARLERFDREARAIAALNHPHIVTIYSTEEADGVRFLTMELVDGETLTDLVGAGPMPLARFLDIGLALADALSAAHQKQITHRDLKPGNVMVSREGRVKVLDFGLARIGAVPHPEQSLVATQAPITELGMVVGTMPYMSPEQIEGRPIDPRSDLFSLGVIFYELLSGERPFKGASSPAVMSAILRDTPSNLTEIRPDVPEALARLVARCLEKRPDDRVQTARDVYNELRHVQKQVDSGVRSTTALRMAAATSGASTLCIIVLPFSVRGADPEGELLATGLTEDITTGMAKFRGLSVAAPQSVRAFKDAPLDVRQIAEQMKARYVVGGSVRKSGNAVRITGQLIDAKSGTQLWTETYDRRLDGTDVFGVQDDVTDHIVATVADTNGVLARSMVQEIRRQTTVSQSTADQLLLRSWGFHHNPLPADHAELRTAFEAMVKGEPENANLWATLATLYLVEHSLYFNPLPDSLERAMRAARRAIEIDHVSQEGWQWLALGHFYSRDRAGFEDASTRAIRINPRNAHTLAWMGNMWTHAGEYDRGCALTERAMAINAGHPGWLHFAVFNRHFARGEFADALHAARRVNMPEFVWMHLAIAAAAGHLGRQAEARAAADVMSRLAPFLSDDEGGREFLTRWYWPETVIESLLEGIRRARSNTARPPVPTARVESDSGSASAFLINVLPFQGQGADAEGLAEGLSQSIVVALSRYAYLRVIARASASLPAAGYLLKGSVQSAGSRLRIVAQLTEAAAGTSIWAETFDRDLVETPLFELQDALTATIVATIADMNGALVRSMAHLVREKPADRLTPYEAVLMRIAYINAISPTEHLRVREALEHATKHAPSDAMCWASLAGIYIDEYAEDFNPRPDPLGRARAAAHKAIELDSASQAAYAALAHIAYFSRDMSAFRAARDRALTINPLNTGTLALMGSLTAYSGDWDAGIEMCQRAMTLNPHHPGIYWVSSVFNQYRLGNYTAALDLLNRITMPNYPNAWMMRAAIYGQLGRLEQGRAALRDAEARLPGITDRTSDARRKWLSEDLVVQIQEGLDKLAPRAPSSVEARPGTATIAREASIAVLPFTDLSPAKDQNWFCDGIAEELLNALSRLPGLHVAARASTFAMRGKADDLNTIGEKLNVKTVLEGSVRRAGDRVRITAQLSDVEQGRQLWSERFDREMQDIFDVQDDIARAIADRLRVTLVGGSGVRLVARATDNLDAYQLLLQGRMLLMRRGHAILEAMALFERAIGLDPELTEAHALLADTHRLIGLYGIMPAAEAMPRARAAAERALAIDPHQVEALATLANIAAVYDWDLAAARALSDRALQIDPSHVRALAERAIVLGILETPPPAIEDTILASVAKARAVDPLNAWVLAIEAFCHTFAGRTTEAVAAAEQSVALDQNNFTGRWSQTFSLAAVGRNGEAEEAAAPALAMSDRHPRILAELAAMHARAGEAAAAEAIWHEVHERAQRGHVGFAEQSAIAASAGHLVEARQLLARAIEGRDPYLGFWKLPAWGPALNDPECATLLRTIPLMKRTE